MPRFSGQFFAAGEQMRAFSPEIADGNQRKSELSRGPGTPAHRGARPAGRRPRLDPRAWSLIKGVVMNRKKDDSRLLIGFLQEYERYVKEVLQPTHLEIQKVLEIWQQPGHWSKYTDSRETLIPTPVRTAISRSKRPEQVVDKILRKPHKFPKGLKPVSFRTMYDTIGVRVVVYFLSHLPLIDRELRNAELIEIWVKEPPVVYMNADQAKILSLDHMEHVYTTRCASRTAACRKRNVRSSSSR
jgi:hypothetical protein